MSDGPKQLIVFPGTSITGRDNVQEVTSEAGEHVGPCFPVDTNEGNMLPFQETLGAFTETEIDYRLMRTGGVGSATWGWKLKDDADNQWRGQPDIRYQTGAHDPFRAFAGKEGLGADGIAVIVSKIHNRLLLFKRFTASSVSGAVKVAYRDLGAPNQQEYSTFTFQPSSLDESPDCQMRHVAGCELPDGTLRLIGNTYDDGLNDLHLFGSVDGGITWTLLQQNIITRWFNQTDESRYPTEVRNINQLRMASSGDWMRIVWYSGDGRLHTMCSSDRGATWESLSRLNFKSHYQPKLTQDLLDDPLHYSGSPIDAVYPGGAESISNNTPDYMETPQYSYFDIVGLDNADGGFTLITVPRSSADSTDIEGIEPRFAIVILSAVRDTDWAVARGIEGETETGMMSSGEMADKTNEGRNRFGWQHLHGYTQLTACATPFWLYIFAFATPGGTGWNDSGVGGNSLSPTGGHYEITGGGGYYRQVSASIHQPAAGAWACSYQYCGWIGWRVPINDPYGGTVQTLHGSAKEGMQFPGGYGQGKMFAPFNVRCAWAGDRIVMIHGATYNGAHDGAIYTAYGLTAEVGGASDDYPAPFSRYQRPAAPGALTPTADPGGEDTPARVMEEGYARRGASIDNPIRWSSGSKLSQYSAGKSWCCVSWFGGWDRRPITEEDDRTIGDDDSNYMFGDYWSVQYGLPHVNAGFNGGSLADLASVNNGGTRKYFNIIGPGTPSRGTYDLGTADADGTPTDFIDTAQGASFMSDLRLGSLGTDGLGAAGTPASVSQWTSVSDVIGGMGDYQNASAWHRRARNLGDKALDWEMDRVTMRVNFYNTRTTSNEMDGVGSRMFFSSSARDLPSTSGMSAGARTAGNGFRVGPSRTNRTDGASIYVTPGTTYSDSTFIPLGNGSLIGWTVSVPSAGLQKASGATNPNAPVSAVATGSYKYCAVEIFPILEEGGSGSGGDLRVSEIAVIMGSDTVAVVDSYSDVTLAFEQVNKGAGSTYVPPGGSGFGSTTSPVFWDFRLSLYRNDDDDQRGQLAFKRTGTDEEWTKTSYFTVPTRAAIEGATADNQKLKWGLIDTWVDSPGGEYEYLAHWREFYVSYIGTGTGWSQASPSNPIDLAGLPTSSQRAYVTNGIYARWGGGGGFQGDQFTGTIDHTHAVENIFRASPYTGWKSDLANGGTASTNMNSESIAFSVDPVTAATASTENNTRSDASWLALYGLHDRTVVVDVSYKKDFATAYTDTFQATSLLTTISINGVIDNVLRYADPQATGGNKGWFKEGALAGKYIGWVDSSATGNPARTAKILTNRTDETSDQGLIWIDPDNVSPGMCIHDTGLSGYGLGAGTGLTADIWSDRCAIDLLSDSSRVIKHGDETVWRRGFSFLRLRFPGSVPEAVGSLNNFGGAGYHTIDGQHAVGAMVLGRGLNMDVPLQWGHSDSTEANVNITTLASGQKTSYRLSRPRRSLSFEMPGDIDSFRKRVQNVLGLTADYTKKPVALLLQTDSAATRADDRFNVLARYSGTFNNANVGWKLDENNVWTTIGDVSVKFDEEL